MLDDFFFWFRYSDVLEKAIAMTLIVIFLIIIVAIIDPSNTVANRKTFCLERGYDKYEVSQENFYCKNAATGAIKKFPDPNKKKVKAEKRSWE